MIASGKKIGAATNIIIAPTEYVIQRYWITFNSGFVPRSIHTTGINNSYTPASAVVAANSR